MFSTVGDDFSWDVSINEIFYLLEPFIFLANEVFLTQIDKIDDRLGSDESVSVYDSDLVVSPFSVPNPLVFLEQFKYLHQNILFFSCLFGIVPLYNLLQILQSVGNVLQILEYKLTVDDIHISNRINRIFSVGDIFILESSHNVVDAIDVSDVTQKVVAQSFTL